MRAIEDIFYQFIIKPLIFRSRLGRKSMFGYADSGLNFDHIYRNVAIGYTKFGKLIDRILLNLPSAKATRYRKQKIIELLEKEVSRNISCGKKTRIVDLASGPSRYLVDLITEANKNFVEALCFDMDHRNIEFGRKIAGDRPLLFKRADVLKLGHYQKLSQKVSWRPNLVVCSGLYEYLQDEEVKHSLHEIAASLDDRGLVLFVTQMNNPNKKLIEKLGKTKQGKPWILHYRQPGILKEWMIKAGFKEINIEIDPWKMYVFCSGRKIANETN
ncbi:MAG: class I SAM-dependent methyltransferase family protein [Candidatus Omnitrophica bacterium]|nr:class I SAM-dependent methyltransferase family protein [Candidatus Omnitrophota bacterium]